MCKGLSTIPFERLFSVSTATNARGHFCQDSEAPLSPGSKTIFLLRAYCRPLEQRVPARYQLQYRQLFQELSEQNSSYKDGLLRGLAGPHGLLASSGSSSS